MIGHKQLKCKEAILFVQGLPLVQWKLPSFSSSSASLWDTQGKECEEKFGWASGNPCMNGMASLDATQTPYLLYVLYIPKLFYIRDAEPVAVQVLLNSSSHQSQPLWPMVMRRWDL